MSEDLFSPGTPMQAAAVTALVTGDLAKLSDSPSAQGDRLRAWVATAMQTLRCGTVPNSEVKFARVCPLRVPALRNIIATGDSEERAVCNLQPMVEGWAEKRLASGTGLPGLRCEAADASPAIVRCIRMRTLRNLVMERGAEWGVQRVKLSRAFLMALATDFDSLVTQRVSSLLKSAQGGAKPDP